MKNFKKTKINGKFIANVGIFSALGLVFDLLAKVIGIDPWSAGGSISIAMVPIFIMAYYYGVLGGLACGFIVGAVQMLWGSPEGFLGAMLDYVLPYTCVGLAGLFIYRGKKTNSCATKYLFFVLSMIVAGLLRVFFHTLSGVLLYKATWWASLVYNAPYVLISIGLSAILTSILIDRLDFIFGKEEDDEEDAKENEVSQN